jgi:hypothetical protein
MAVEMVEAGTAAREKEGKVTFIRFNKTVKKNLVVFFYSALLCCGECEYFLVCPFIPKANRICVWQEKRVENAEIRFQEEVGKKEPTFISAIRTISFLWVIFCVWDNNI